jgi:putative membrane protein
VTLVTDAPDPRFSLANERTFLAWVRTALAFVAFGVAIPALMHHVWSGTATKVSAGALLLVGAVLAVGATVRWRRVEGAIERGEAVPPAYLAPVLLAVVLFAIALAFVVVLALPG